MDDTTGRIIFFLTLLSMART